MPSWRRSQTKQDSFHLNVIWLPEMMVNLNSTKGNQIRHADNGDTNQPARVHRAVLCIQCHEHVCNVVFDVLVGRIC